MPAVKSPIRISPASRIKTFCAAVKTCWSHHELQLAIQGRSRTVVSEGCPSEIVEPRCRLLTVKPVKHGPCVVQTLRAGVRSDGGRLLIPALLAGVLTEKDLGRENYP